jgi:hypothetical protein
MAAVEPMIRSNRSLWLLVALAGAMEVARGRDFG